MLTAVIKAKPVPGPEGQSTAGKANKQRAKGQLKQCQEA